jgi:hypothetical protein
MKWFYTTGHRVNALKSHDEVSNDNRDEKETDVHGGLQGRLLGQCAGGAGFQSPEAGMDR